jgi:transposase InsO family protein
VQRPANRCFIANVCSRLRRVANRVQGDRSAADRFHEMLSSGGVKAVVAENLVLKHQLLILTRRRQRAPRLLPLDRFLLGLGSLFLNARRIPKIAVVVRPSTILRFHRCLARRKYRDLFSSKKRSKPGPRGPSEELIRAIVELKRRNPRFGCPRIALIISKTFGIEINKDVVRRVLAKRYDPDQTIDSGAGPSWLTFLGHAKDSLWSVDLFRCESITLTTHWVLIVVDQFTRRIVGFAVQRGTVNGPQLCRMFNDATHGAGTPKRLSTDHDPIFQSHRWKSNLRVLGIEEVKTVAHVPTSHPFVERLIGTVRREFLDDTIFWNRIDLERKLSAFRRYYNSERVHQSHVGRTSDEIACASAPLPAQLHSFRWKSTCNRLVQLPIAS